MPRKTKTKIVVFGAGGHAKVALDTVKSMGRYVVVGLLDNSMEFHGKTRWGYKVLGGRDQFAVLHKRGVKHLIAALGDNRQRQTVFEEAVKAGLVPVSVVHPSAQLGSGLK